MHISLTVYSIDGLYKTQDHDPINNAEIRQLGPTTAVGYSAQTLFMRAGWCISIVR